MSSSKLWMAGVLVAGVALTLCVLWWSSSRASAPRGVPVPRETRDARGVRDASLVSPEELPEVESSATGAPESGARVHAEREPTARARAVLAGRVVLPEGFVHSEEVWVVTGGETDLQRPRGRMAPDGAFSLQVPASPALVKLGLDSRFLSLSPPVFARPGQLDVVLQPSAYGVLAGRIVLPPAVEAQAALAGVRLRWGTEDLDGAILATRPSLYQDFAPSADGTFALDHVAPGVPLLLHVKSPFGPNRMLELTPLLPGEERHVEVVLAPGIRLEGIVLDEHGLPVPGVPILVGETGLEAPPGNPWSGSTPASDREGRFRVTRVGLEVTRVRTQGDLLRQGEVALDPSRGDALDLVLRVTRGGTITGDVTWPDGTQPVSFSVQVEGPGYQDRSGHTGRFQVRGVPPGRYQVRVRAAREGILGRAMVDGVEPDGAPLRLVLVEEASCTLTGVVLDGSEEPVEQFQVFADQVGGDQRRDSARGSEGRFQLKHLAAGAWILRVSARGFLDAERRVELSAGSTQEPRIVLTGAGRIRGRVVDESGRAVTGAWVGEESYAYVARHLLPGEGGTDAEGRFELEPGTTRVRLLALSKEHGPSETLELEVPPGHTVENVELRLTPACRLAGRVLDEDGRPLAGARVAVAARIHLQDMAETDARGHFELLSLPPGQHKIVATHESRPGALASASATVVSDSTGLELRFQKEKPVVLEGRVTRGARPWSGPVRLFSRHGQAELEVGADGLFRATLRWPGDWTGAILLDGDLGEMGADLRRWDLVVPEAERHVVALELESLPPLRQPWDLWR